jgi:AraC family transcriptional regulator of adaptative response/methylated-DNA-[protein]-cysteine methyltransferase
MEYNLFDAPSAGASDREPMVEGAVLLRGNPIAILVPCHRVLKKDGSISGYRWGVRRKRALIEREQLALHGRK